MKFNKKKWTWIFALLLVVSWSSVQAVNHYVSGYDSVNNGEIRYTVDFDHSDYYNDFNYAKNIWNNYSDAVQIKPYALGNHDLKIYEIYDWQKKYFGAYIPKEIWWDYDKIEINHFWINWYNFNINQKRSTIMHELGHSLGLDHSYSGNVMYRWNGGLSQVWLGNQDKVDYDYLWN